MIKHLGDIIKESIYRKNMTQKQVAKLLHISPQTLSNFVSNRRLPNLELFVQIAQLLDLDVDYALGLNNHIGEDSFDIFIATAIKHLSHDQKELLSNQVHYYQIINHLLSDLRNWSDNQGNSEHIRRPNV